MSNDDVASADLPPASGPRLRRTWPQRFVLVGGMVLVVVSLASAWGLAETYNSVGEIQRHAVAPGLLADELGSATEARNILLVGSTATDGIEEGDEILTSRGNERLADTVMLLRIEPLTGQAMAMSINRDLWVPNVAGFTGKINEAYAYGDIDKLIEIINVMLRVEVHNFAIINFAGFRGLIDELDGVPVYFPHPSYDRDAFFEIDAGCHVLDGETALNYVRARRFVQVVDGRPVRDLLSDFTRTERQRDFLILTMQRAVDRGVRNPTELRRLFRAVTDGGAVTVDEKISPGELVRIGNAFGDFDPEEMQRAPLPIEEFRTAGGADALRLDEAQAEPLLNYFRGLGYTITNEDVSARVIDGRTAADRDGDEIRPDRDLMARGFVSSGYSAASDDDLTDRTTITYSAENERKARLLARNLATRPQLVPVTGRTILTLTVGTDWTGTLDQPMSEEAFAAAEPAPTTTTVVGGESTAAPTTVAPTTTTAVGDTNGGIIGKPPEGVTCG